MADMLTALFKPFFGISITATYSKAHNFIDFVAYIIIFLFITRYAISKRFEGKTANSLSWVLAVVLAIGMSVGSAKWGFQLGDLGPLAGLIFFGTLGILSYNLLKSFGTGSPSSGAFAFILTYFTLKLVVPKFFDTIEGFAGGTIGNILSFVIWIAVLLVLFSLGHGGYSAVKSTGGGSTLIKGMKSGGKWVGDKARKYNEKRKQRIAEMEKQKQEIDAKIQEIEEKIKKIVDKDTSLLEEESFKNKEEIKQIQYINQELKAMDNLQAQINAIDEEFDKINKENKFKAFNPRLAEIDRILEDYFQKYKKYKEDLQMRIEWLNNQIISKNIKELIKEPEQLMKELEHEIKYLDEEHHALLVEYNYSKQLAYQEDIGLEERKEYVAKMNGYAQQIKEIIKMKKKEEEILEEENIAYKARREMKRYKNIEKNLLKSLLVLTEKIDKGFKEFRYLKSKKDRSEKEDKKIDELKEKLKEYKEIFKRKLNKLYQVEIRNEDINNKT